MTDVSTLSLIDALPDPVLSVGRVAAIRDGIVDIAGVSAPIGDICYLHPAGGPRVPAEIVAATAEHLRSVPLHAPGKLRLGDRVTHGDGDQPRSIDIDGALAINALGECLQPRTAPLEIGPVDMRPRPIAVHERDLIEEQLKTGIAAIDECLPIGFGQRIGVFAAAGTGKSTLIRDIMRNAEADHIVVALVGERSREVVETIRSVEASEHRDRVTIVVGVAGDPAPMRADALTTSLAISQHFACRGKKVLHLVDSLTRYAFAIREIGLAVGEPMAQSGMTPSVYKRLSETSEMSGCLSGGGSVTSVSAVLMETEQDDALSSYIRSLLDGHVYLTKQFAERGVFPAIDILRSRSRLDVSLFDGEEMRFAQKIRDRIVEFQKVEEYLQFTGYQAGSNPQMDSKVEQYDLVMRWLRNEHDFERSGDSE